MHSVKSIFVEQGPYVVARFGEGACEVIGFGAFVVGIDEDGGCGFVGSRTSGEIQFVANIVEKFGLVELYDERYIIHCYYVFKE